TGRGTAWWPFVAAFVVAPWLSHEPPAAFRGDAVEAPIERPTPPRLRRLNAAIAVLLGIVGVALLPAWRPVGPAGVPEGSLSYAPQGIAAALRQLSTIDIGPQAAVWNPQAWGSWLEFAAPSYHYAVDSRIELFPATVWADDEALHSGDLRPLGRHPVVVLVTDHQADSQLEAALAASHAFAPIVQCREGTIWLSETIARSYAGPPSGCPGD
ncbi:MAG TPA: hypothetical protein VET90_05090, partial [Candidatus Binatus sp.]|nr:hypothetical protein [Candidatus Binatus sp.]